MLEPHTRQNSVTGPLHAILLSFPVALHPATLLADLAYRNTSVIQWTNFAQWLNAGAQLFGGLVLAWAIIELIIGRNRRGRGLVYLVVVAAMFLLGMINAFQHARDGWASVGTLGVLSLACTLLAFVAAYLAFGRTTRQEIRP